MVLQSCARSRRASPRARGSIRASAGLIVAIVVDAVILYPVQTATNRTPPGRAARGHPPHPNSGLPEFGIFKRPKSDISDFGW